MTRSKVYQTSDFYLACYLKCSGCDLVDVQKHGGKVEFFFAEKPMMKSIILGFYNNEGVVPPLAMVDAIKNLKALMYAM